ncbi:MAG: glycoside hydrolase family 3 C-terminal domain-containing protein [Bacteroidetes bacterium]|nr:glycoside hydrolase family 3 C-terminal domain-containing protein [Bacteroidota bacterium]
MKTYLLLSYLVASVFCQAQSSYKYLNPDAPVVERVNDLVSRMTLEQKVAQLLYHAPAIDSLKVPEYNWWNEGLHGVARNGLATSFPQAIGLAATWDKNLMHRVATAISDEARAKFNIAVSKGQRLRYQGLTFWSPNINIFRDPRWGRGMETYGEDPYLTGQMAVQFIRGLQGDDPKYFKTIATAKHYAVHSGPESERHTFNAEVSEYDLRETYLPAFKMSVEDAQVHSLMCAYNSVRGKPCCSNDPLLDSILRKEWGFKGYVVSDCGAINDIWGGHKQAKDAAEASALAVKAGTDLDCGRQYFKLVDAVKRGLIKESEIDVSVKRLFEARIRLGMFDPDDKIPFSKLGEKEVDSKAHRILAEEAALKSIVLLKNEKNTLPLKKDIKTIAVIGPNANDEHCLLANYNGFPTSVSTPLEGIKNKVSSNTKVLYETGCEVAPGVPYVEPVNVDYLFTTADKKVKGLKAEYFSNQEAKGEPVKSKVDTEIDVMAADMKGDFSVRWTGVLVPPLSGKYYLGCRGGNDFDLFLDDSLLVTDGNDPDNDFSLKQVSLEKGKAYHIKVLVGVNAPRSPFVLLWSLPDMEREKRALEAVRQADVVVFCGGLSPRLEGEEMDVEVPGFSGGDRIALELPSTQEDLIKKIVATGKPVVLVLVNGSAVSINWEKANISAIVESWYGGQASGTALADVLFGDYNPAGRLPVTFYKNAAQLPDFHDYNMKGKTYRYFDGEALYPFGYGLSYTSFIYSPLAPKGGTITASKPVAKISVNVKNTGTRDGEEVVQLYVKGKGTAVGEAVKTLKGFERVAIKAGETKTVSFDVSAQTLASFKKGKGFTTDKGEYALLIGSSSADKDLKEVKVGVE